MACQEGKGVSNPSSRFYGVRSLQNKEKRIFGKLRVLTQILNQTLLAIADGINLLVEQFQLFANIVVRHAFHSTPSVVHVKWFA